MSSRRKQKEIEIELLRLKISELLLLNQTERQIAQAVGRSASTVHHHIVHLLREWRHAQAGNIDKWRARQLARIEAIERESWSAWEQSKQRKTVTQRMRGRAPRPRRGRRLRVNEETMVDVSRSTRVQESAGDERFLARLSWCVAERNLMLGLYGLNVEESPIEPPSADEYAAARGLLLEVVTGARR